MEALAAVGFEIDEFGCAADLDEQGPQRRRGDPRQASWLVSYMPLAPTAALDAAGVLRHNRGVEIVFNTTDINPQPPSHWFQP